MGLPEINRSRIERLQREISTLQAELDTLQGDVEQIDPVVTDESFPNIVPPQPTNVHASALFRSIQIMWAYDGASYISHYEVYASKGEGFVPLDSDLIWKGKDGAYQHPASLGETWYFRVRAVNTHGVAGEFSAEVSASTVDISGFEIDETYKIDLIQETNQYTDARKTEIMEEVANKLDAQVYHDNIILKADQEFVVEELKKKLDQEGVQTEIDKALDELVITQDKIEAGAVGTNQLEAGAITEQKMKWSTHLIF